ncbi:uncharacterized protein LOC100690875 isoform X2 [Oreochromis niloticus]|uniref:uncharacterized protein LOC100690875 isoform X2 n=1 Tax=Oreochromis niloticus TaxID=8128 RepID=UPI0003943172|nr:uncharacterized protein LOC100690875 isoform X2 [Oreochromis niloticus]
MSVFIHLNWSHQLLKSIWEISCLCFPGSVTKGVHPASKGWLRRFLLLKLVTVLLFPHGVGLPLLLGCVFSLRALLLLRSPHISTKPSTVLLSQLALSDSLVLLHWALRLGVTLGRWMEEVGWKAEVSFMKEGKSVWWREAAKVLCHQLLDAHQLASLLLLGLLGLEATLVSRWPQQTRKFRTSRWAQLSCRLAWMLVLLELTSLLHFKTLQDFRLQMYPSAFHRPGIMLPPSLPTLSCYLRKMLWLVNSWLHYAIFYGQPQRRKSCYH